MVYVFDRLACITFYCVKIWGLKKSCYCFLNDMLYVKCFNNFIFKISSHVVVFCSLTTAVNSITFPEEFNWHVRNGFIRAFYMLYMTTFCFTVFLCPFVFWPCSSRLLFSLTFLFCVCRRHSLNYTAAQMLKLSRHLFLLEHSSNLTKIVESSFDERSDHVQFY